MTPRASTDTVTPEPFQAAGYYPITHVQPHPEQPRKHFDAGKLEELTASVKAIGIVVPLLLWPRDDKESKFYIIAGERRFRAAQKAGLTAVPAIVRAGLTEDQVIELMLVENTQREDLNAMEEAEAFALLQRRSGLATEDIAKRIGKSTRYVQASLELLRLAKPAAEALRAGTLSKSNAVEMARLSPTDQAKALEDGLWEPLDLTAVTDEEHALLRAAEDLTDKFNVDRAKKVLGKQKPEDVLPRREKSVREFQDWVRIHTRVEPAGQLLEDIKTATDGGAKVVEVSLLHKDEIRHELGEDDKLIEGVLFAGKWKRADGTVVVDRYTGKKSPAPKCEHAVMGVVVYGPESGTFIQVCTAIKDCKIHWAREQKDARARARLNPNRGKNKAKAEKERQAYEARQAEQDREWKVREKASPAFRAALLKKITAKAAIRHMAHDIQNANYYELARFGKVLGVKFATFEAAVVKQHPELAKGYKKPDPKQDAKQKAKR